VDIGHRYFHSQDAHAHEVVSDARYWLDTQAGHYDVVALDAYRQPYIPFHLTTKEFFSSVKEHLDAGGVAAVNVGRTATDYRLVAAIASTMAAVFKNVYLFDVPNYDNTLVFGTTEDTSVADINANLGRVTSSLAQQPAQLMLTSGLVRPSPYHGQVFTDDLAPVERLIDEIIFNYVTG
jgi:spermidine synthase